MKYVFRTLWVIGYIPVFIFMFIGFLVMMFVYPLIGVFYFVKTGDCEIDPVIPDVIPTPDVIPIIIDNAYKKLLKYIC